MVRVAINQLAGIIIYLVAITGISFLGMKLSSAVGEQAIVLALPLLDNGPRKLSLIEQRRIDAKLATPPLPEGARIRVADLEAPATPANILAARLDLAEREDLIETASSAHVASAADGSPSSIAGRVYEMRVFRTVRNNSRH